MRIYLKTALEILQAADHWVDYLLTPGGSSVAGSKAVESHLDTAHVIKSLTALNREYERNIESLTNECLRLEDEIATERAESTVLTAQLSASQAREEETRAEFQRLASERAKFLDDRNHLSRVVEALKAEKALPPHRVTTDDETPANGSISNNPNAAECPNCHRLCISKAYLETRHHCPGPLTTVSE